MLFSKINFIRKSFHVHSEELVRDFPLVPSLEAGDLLEILRADEFNLAVEIRIAYLGGLILQMTLTFERLFIFKFKLQGIIQSINDNVHCFVLQEP
jgi:hypothetical protein